MGDGKILIGETEDGLELPALISLVYYTFAMEVMNDSKIIECDELIMLSRKTMESIKYELNICSREYVRIRKNIELKC